MRYALLAGAVGCAALVPLDELRPRDGGGDASDATVDAGCGSTLTDPENCGRCGRSCCGGVCSRGVCAPRTVVAGLTDVPKTLAADARYVYWASQVSPQVWFADVDVGQPSTLLDNASPTRLLPKDGRVYFDWPDAGIASVDRDGSVGWVWRGAPNPDPIVGAQRVSWSVFGGDGGCAQGCVLSALGDGGDLRVSATLNGKLLDLVGEGNTGLVVLSGPKQILTFPSPGDGGAPALLWGDAGYSDPTVGERVYVAESISGSIGAIEWTGAYRDIVQGQGGIRAVATQGDDLVWIAGRDVRGCKAMACAATVETLATDEGAPTAITFGGACVYWVSPDTKSIRRTGL